MTETEETVEEGPRRIHSDGEEGRETLRSYEEARGMVTGLGVVYLTVGFLLVVFLGIFAVSWFSLMP